MTNDELYYRRDDEIIADVTANWHNKRLDRLAALMSQFNDLMAETLLMTNMPHSEFTRTAIDMEQSLVELINDDWVKSADIVGTYRELPKSVRLKAWEANSAATHPSVMFAEELKSNRIVTNPATENYGE